MALTAQLHDGRTLEFPDGTDPAIVQATVKKVLGAAPAGPPPAMFTPSGEKPLPKMTDPEMIAAQPAVRFAQGAAAPILGAVQLGAHALGSKAAPAMDEMLRRNEEMKKGGVEGVDFWEMAGQVLSPAFLKAAKAMPAGETYVKKILAGIGLGSGAGITTPVTTEGEFGPQKAAQTGVGAGVGGVLPAAATPIAASAKGLYHGLVEPVVAPTAIKGRAYLGAAGDKVDEIIAALRNPRQIVPGSAPTAGEAAVPAGSAEFSNLQRQAAQINPTPYVARQDAQNAARIAALRTVGQDEAALKAATAARAQAAGPLYEASRTASEYVAAPNTAPVLAKVKMILDKNPGNRELVTELTNIKNGLEKAGSDPTKVSSVLDGLKASIANKDNKFIGETLGSIKNDLSKALPGYEQAQAKFAQMSRPVNQMQVGQELEKRLVPALSDEAKQRATTFATATREAPKTIERATGAPRFEKLEQVLTPEQMKTVNGIQADLARGARLEDLAQKGTQAAPDISVGMGNQKLPNLLNRHVMLANAVISRLEGRVNKKIAGEIAAEMLNPAKTGESLAQAQARSNRNKAIAATIQPYLRGAQQSAAVSAARATE